MTVDQWMKETQDKTHIFSRAVLMTEAGVANPSWKFLSEYGKHIWLCQYANPLTWN